MILSGILGALALLSLVLTLWQWLAARRFPLHHRHSDRSPAPAVTLLKPVKGADEHTEACLRSWFVQDYAGETQILFAVASAEDEACPIIQRLISEFPQRDAQLVVCSELLGTNAKVSKLIQLELLAKHELLIVSDADVRVPEDLLAKVVWPIAEGFPKDLGQPKMGENPGPARSLHVPLARNADFNRQPGPRFRPLPAEAGVPVQGGNARPRLEVEAPQEPVQCSPARTPDGRCKSVGLVNCFYQLANPTTGAMRWEAVAINADFWSQVLQSKSLRPLDFALGAVMALRRECLVEIGGFRALADCLADDYQLGQRIARQGHRIELCPVVVACWSAPMGWRAVWRHQLRWARTIRVCQPAPYFFSILGNATFWPLLWLALCPGRGALMGVVGLLLTRLILANDLIRRLTRRGFGFANLWLVWVKDLLQVALWAGAFLGNDVEWRGTRMQLRRDGTLVRK